MSCLLGVLPSGATGAFIISARAPIAGPVDCGTLGDVSGVRLKVGSASLCSFCGAAVGAEYDEVEYFRRVLVHRSPDRSKAAPWAMVGLEVGSCWQCFFGGTAVGANYDDDKVAG